MNELKMLCEIIGTDRVEKLRDYILDSIERDIDEAIHDSYNYVISPDTFTEFGEDVFYEVKEELKKKYKKQLKGVLEAKILKVIEKAEKVIEVGGNE